MANFGSGDLRERVAFDMRAQVDDGYGNHQAGFAEVFTCRAGFTYLRGSEAVIAARLEGRQPIVVRIRASEQAKQIGPDWRMRDLRTGEEYAVRSAAPTPDRQFVDIMVESGVAA